MTTLIPLSSFTLFMASPKTERAQDSPWAIGALAEEAPPIRLRFASEAELGRFLSFTLLAYSILISKVTSSADVGRSPDHNSRLPVGETQLIDILTLGKLAFTTTSQSGKILKSGLQDPNVPKCPWDVKNEANALWVPYKVGLDSVTNRWI